ncbi:hypothetical protein GXW78_23360 [Roseomonas terrae]|jgi:hypothetical protein|uniref:Uncharacterized protein n=1 Tax=Neoroseomonas terrae TaxID=424799 RepID=A0ABS5ENK7_9PROT|nr:hypothetical protein [Neoroseomonas terrae]MBR0652615.1 hypothetical protein [Neoroseomonas terrae]
MRGTALRPFLFAALLFGATPAFAQSACPGRISANVFAPVPRDAAVAVPERPGGGPNDRRLREAVLGALATAGRRVDANAPYILSWRGGTSIEGDNFGGFNDRSSGRTFRESDDISWTQNVPRAGGRNVPTIRVSGTVDLRERATQRIVWTAVITCSSQARDDASLFTFLANAVMPHIGQAAAGRPF